MIIHVKYWKVTFNKIFSKWMVWNSGQSTLWYAFYHEVFDSSILHTFSGGWILLPLENVTFQTWWWMCIQHDGATPDFVREVTEYLNENYQRWWRVQDGPIAWLCPRSQLLWLLLWSCITYKVWHTCEK